MSLRLRLIVLVAFALLISLACGGALVGWHEAHSVQAEMRAALDVGEKAVRLGLHSRVRPHEQADDLRHLIDSFTGNRHVRATLLGERDKPLATSELLRPMAAYSPARSSLIEMPQRGGGRSELPAG